MTAKIIPFPIVKSDKPDPLDLLAARLAGAISDLPERDNSGDQLKLLRRIDRKLSQLIKDARQGGDQ